MKTRQVYSKDLFKLLFDVSLFYENGEKGTIVIFNWAEFQNSIKQMTFGKLLKDNRHKYIFTG